MINGLAKITLKKKKKNIKKFHREKHQQNFFSQSNFIFLLKFFLKLLKAIDVIYKFYLHTFFTFLILINSFERKKKCSFIKSRKY